MTYCVGLLLDAGMVFASDSRTNAGVDQVSSFRKMKVFERTGDRVIVILSSGNLSVTQNAINLIETREKKPELGPTVWEVKTLSDVAGICGESLRQVRQRDAAFLQESNVDASASFIVGGQIAGERMRLFMIYAEGNFIEASEVTPYFQIGETKYGKPVIDRIITPETKLIDATKCVLVSFDSTMRSNISVGLPIDLVVCEQDALCVGLQRNITESDPYFQMIHNQWADGLRRVFAELPDPSWTSEST
ncbi:MAG: proteasome-type protease [Gammaproteobacteria bacterium]|nr:proteasome-type protease [Gammaproteobacteria bacterium]